MIFIIVMSEEAKPQESEDLKMYIVVNRDIEMSAGKLGAQTAHSACLVVSYLEQNPTEEYIQWKSSAFAKIVLKAHEKEMIKMIEKYHEKSEKIFCIPVFDAGRTELQPNTLTTLAFPPMKRSDRPQLLKRLQCL